MVTIVRSLLRDPGEGRDPSTNRPCVVSMGPGLRRDL